MNNQIVIDPHTLDGRKETWTLRFEHYISTHSRADRPGLRDSIRVNIKLEAFKKGPTTSMDEHVEIGKASFITGHKPDTIIITSHPDAEDFVAALLEDGRAKKIGQTIDRHQDYPGADETEEFRYQHLDITGFYNEFMKEKREDLLDAVKSPLTHIFQCEGQVTNGQNPADYITCRIGGIEQDRAWVGYQGRELFNLMQHYPDARYQLQEMAQKAYAPQLALYRQAQQRVTEPTTRFRTGNHYIRCKIDGQQMLSRMVDRLDWCDYDRDRDFAALAAKYYAGQLNVSVKNGRGMTL